MATKTGSTKTSSQQRNATIQWIALGVAAVLAVLAAFTFFGDDGAGTGGHSGLAPTSQQAG